MNILEQGCPCKSCLVITKRNLEESREKWSNGKREIIFKPYDYSCGDGCCDNYGTDVFINGFQITGDGENVESVVSSLMEFLEVDNVIVETKYDDEDEY